MEGTKKHLIFDLDDTIWDYQQNSEETLNELHATFDLKKYDVSSADLLSTFRLVNNGLWDDFDKGVISREFIRKERFPAVFKKLSLNLNGVAMQMQDNFMEICSSKKGLVSGVAEVLEQLGDTYVFHILSNGFDQIQFKKLRASGIEHVFDKIITSGRAGYRKPQPEIFEYVLNEIDAEKQECVMIGDNPLSDIEGAYNFGIDQIYYNVHNKECAITPSHTIYNMNELLRIL